MSGKSFEQGLVENGFAIPNGNDTITYFRKHPEQKFTLKLFTPSARSGRSKGGTKNSSQNIFGVNKIRVYYTDIGKVEVYLERLFLEKNPNPDPHLRHAFTTLLHDHGLHWTRCVHR